MTFGKAIRIIILRIREEKITSLGSLHRQQDCWRDDEIFRLIFNIKLSKFTAQ